MFGQMLIWKGLLVARSALKWRLLGPAASPLMQPRKKAHVRGEGKDSTAKRIANSQNRSMHSC